MKEHLLSLLNQDFLLYHLLPAGVTLVVSVLLGWWIRRLLRKLVFRLTDVDKSAMRVIAQCVVWGFYAAALIAMLSFLGMNTNGLLAGLSAAGLAIGIALRDTLANVAAGFQILFLRPISTGDYVQCGSVAGTIERVGLFSTQLRTFDGLFVNTPNSLLCNAPLTNYSRNPVRRLDVSVGISYADSLDTGLKVLLEVASKEERLLSTPAEPSAFVAKLDESSVVLTLRAWVARENYFAVLFDLTRAVKLGVEAAGLTIPFPQRDVHLDHRAP